MGHEGSKCEACEKCKNLSINSMQNSIQQFQKWEPSSDLKQQVLARKCPVHKQTLIEYIHIIPSQQSQRLCNKCREERDIPNNEVVHIRSLLDASPEDTFLAYPFLSDRSAISEIEKIKERLNQMKKELLIFFKDMIKIIEQAILQQAHSQREILNELFDNEGKKPINQLSYCSELGQFKRIVCGVGQDDEEKDNSDQLRNFLKKKKDDSINNTIALRKTITDWNNLEMDILLNKPREILKQIKDQIGNINLIGRREKNRQSTNECKEDQELPEEITFESIKPSLLNNAILQQIKSKSPKQQAESQKSNSKPSLTKISSNQIYIDPSEDEIKQQKIEQTQFKEFNLKPSLIPSSSNKDCIGSYGNKPQKIEQTQFKEFNYKPSLTKISSNQIYIDPSEDEIKPQKNEQTQFKEFNLKPSLIPSSSNKDCIGSYGNKPQKIEQTQFKEFSLMPSLIQSSSKQNNIDFSEDEIELFKMVQKQSYPKYPNK